MNALDLINDERLRQQSDEGFSREHDDEHSEGELAIAARCYYEHATSAELSPSCNQPGDEGYAARVVAHEKAKRADEELLPCPFCGSPVMFGCGYGWSIHCPRCGQFKNHPKAGLSDGAIAAWWNTRTRISDPEARAKAEKLVSSVLRLSFASVNAVAYDALVDRITELLTKAA